MAAIHLTSIGGCHTCFFRTAWTGAGEPSGICDIFLIGISYLLVICTMPLSLFFCFKVVQEYERAVIFRLGRLSKGGARGPDPVCQQETVQSGGASVMVWDVCSWRDMGPLIRLETTLTCDRYLSILPDHLHSFMSIVHSDGLGQFQQDNATPHESRVATKWLQEHSSDCRHFHWPPKSPEMNIIENIRDALLHAVENSSPPPRTPMDLWTVLKDEWSELLPRYLRTLVESMPHRVAALLCVRGGPTRY
ncbi:hypothetical protein AVEN_14085-1 [Araneus ventricosus]|uniref:Tc1-like transposase DDE domain-containing protein n=1 Tax=Araneus ventricosus TaxID=182803 RepID=A0A4Y2HHX6_ARAVE|nr:hypothetical protein AVEN_14085-1 [Araneus ventricosus]